MTNEEFEQLVAEEFPKAIPEKFQTQIQNVAFLVEDEPSEETRIEEGLGPHETLLGYYRGVPMTARGNNYGIGSTLPDTITLFKIPIEHEARELLIQQQMIKEGKTWPNGPESALLSSAAEYQECLHTVVRETIWHEVAHYFGMDEENVRRREEGRDIAA